VAADVIEVAREFRRFVVVDEAAEGPPAVEPAVTAGDDEPGRDDRPCPRDPRGACPAISHVSPACDSSGRWVRCVSGMFPFVLARGDDPAVPPVTVLAEPKVSPHRLRL